MPRRQDPADYSRPTAYNPSDVPFTEANLDLGEIPLEDLDSFVVPGRDEKGAYVTVRLNLQPHMERHCKIVVHSHRFPYLDIADFIRHAIARHLRWTVSLRHSLPKHLIPEMDLILEACRDNELRIQVEQALERIEAQVKYHQDRSETAEAFKLLGLIRAKLEGVQTSTWVRRFQAALRGKYEGLMRHQDEMMEREKELRKRAGEGGGQSSKPGDVQ